MKTFTCPYCNKELENRSLHIEGENEFYCDDCDKIFYIEGNSLYEEGIDSYGEYISVLTDNFMPKAATEETLERLGGDVQMVRLYGDFEEFQLALNRVYGVPYGVGDKEGATSPDNDPNAWVICPQCGEPIYVCDALYDEKDYWDCPACCCAEDGVDIEDYEDGDEDYEDEEDEE
jgi:transcription elongation factor Elf1